MAETTTTTGTAPAAGGEGQTPQQTNQQPTTPTAEQRTAFQKFWDSLFGGKEEPAPGSGEGTKKDGDPAPKEGEDTKPGTPGRQELFRGRCGGQDRGGQGRMGG